MTSNLSIPKFTIPYDFKEGDEIMFKAKTTGPQKFTFVRYCEQHTHCCIVKGLRTAGPELKSHIYEKELCLTSDLDFQRFREGDRLVYENGNKKNVIVTFLSYHKDHNRVCVVKGMKENDPEHKSLIHEDDLMPIELVFPHEG